MAKPKAPTKSMLAAIGHVAAECAAVEQLLRDLFALLIGSGYGHVLTSGEDISHLTTFCLRAARYNYVLTNVQLEQLLRLMKQVDRLREPRNFLIHAVWEKATGPRRHIGVRGRRASTKARGADTHEVQYWSPEKAEHVASQFSEVKDEIEKFISESFDNPPYEIPVERTVWNSFENALKTASGRKDGVLGSEGAD